MNEENIETVSEIEEVAPSDSEIIVELDLLNQKFDTLLELFTPEEDMEVINYQETISDGVNLLIGLMLGVAIAFAIIKGLRG